MDFYIEPQTNDLLITVDNEERAYLREARENDEAFESDRFMWDYIEPVWTNGLSSCIQPEDVGALTSAPMLCEYNADDGAPRGKFWAFMSYQVRSVLDDLIDDGKARWEYGGEIAD